MRDFVLKRDLFLCVKCGRPAEEVHHVEHIKPENIGDPKITLNPDNLQSLCRDCHFAEHRGEHAKGREKADDYPYEFDENGYLVQKK